VGLPTLRVKKAQEHAAVDGRAVREFQVSGMKVVDVRFDLVDRVVKKGQQVDRGAAQLEVFRRKIALLQEHHTTPGDIIDG
jgi:hypothetical protein